MESEKAYEMVLSGAAEAELARMSPPEQARLRERLRLLASWTPVESQGPVRTAIREGALELSVELRPESHRLTVRLKSEER